MRPIKDYHTCYNELNLAECHNLVYHRVSKVKRCLKRLKENLDSSPQARTKLKQYYKIANQKQITKTRSRDLLVLPFMINKVIKLYNGKYYVPLKLIPEFLGRYVSEFVPTRVRGTHSSKGQKPIKRT